ncbi:hypothetical protein C0J52_07719 [Blattella germanica]|nr:hypothetical protein C0J52_07719 [Blattella germanica]
MPGMSTRRLFRSRKVLLEDGLQEAGVLVGEDGKIERILKQQDLVSPQSNVEVCDVEDLVIMPGIVDSHVHVNEPGRTDWEGYWTATRAAAAGGVTTIVDMPLNSIPPTTTRKNLETKIIAAKGKTHIDVAFWGGVVPGNQVTLSKLRMLTPNMLNPNELRLKVRCHIVHLSAAEGLPLVRVAKNSGATLTAETCHHYLTLNSEAIPDRAMQYKCCPPVRCLQNKVNETIIQHKHKVTPYLGKQLDGQVVYTVVRGHLVYQNGKFSPPLGQLVFPNSS